MSSLLNHAETGAQPQWGRGECRREDAIARAQHDFYCVVPLGALAFRPMHVFG